MSTGSLIGDALGAAAHECDRLRADNDRLTKALKRIGNTPKGYQDLCWAIAREALAPAKGGECEACRGQGAGLNYAGAPIECPSCHGEGVKRTVRLSPRLGVDADPCAACHGTGLAKEKSK